MTLLWLAVDYFLGSIPIGWIIGRFYGKDIRQHGSGGIGATNVKRVLGIKWAIVTMLLDIAKGVGAVGLTRSQTGSDRWAIIGGLLAVLGHCFPWYIGWKGGKGAATGLGVLLGIQPLIGSVVFIIWLLTVYTSRYISVASVTGAVSLIVLELASAVDETIRWLMIAVALLVLIMHRSNLQRLKDDTEPKFSLTGGTHESRISCSSDQG